MKRLLFITVLIFVYAVSFSQTLATQVILTGTASDPDGTVVSVKWTQVSGPVSGTIVTPTSYSTLVTGYSIPGIYKYEFAATDNQGGIGRDTMQVTVLAPNRLPKANAGSSITIQLPGQTSFNYAKKEDGILLALTEYKK